MTHLILHKVRGQPAFDVAEKIQIGNEEGWIIPTSGHRAYPYQYWSLDLLLMEVGDDIGNLDPIPTNWPDHYTISEAPARKGMGLSIDIGKILSAIGPKIRRRI